MASVYFVVNNMLINVGGGDFKAHQRCNSKRKATERVQKSSTRCLTQEQKASEGIIESQQI